MAYGSDPWDPKQQQQQQNPYRPPQQQPQQQNPPAGEDFDSWFQRANQAGGGNWDPNSRETKAAYRQHMYQIGGMSNAGGASDNPYSTYTGGTDVTGMRAHARKLGMSEDYQRFGDATMKAWEEERDQNCPPDRPYQAFDGSGCVEKPIDSNKGHMAAGQMDAGGNWIRGGGGGQRGGRRGGGGAAGGGGGMYGAGTADPNLALYQVKQQYADALADPTGVKAWQLFTGQGGQKTFQDTMDQRRAQIAGMPQGPARQFAEQQLAEMETNMKLQLPQNARSAAMQGLQGVIAPELGYVQSERDRRLQQFIANTNRELGFGNLGLSRELGMGNLALGQGQLGLASQQQQYMQNVYNPMQFGQMGADNWLRYQQIQNQNNAGTGAAVGQGIGALANLGSEYLKYKASDIRVKENIAPGRRGLSDLLKLKQYRYNYKGQPEKTQSVMAQDLEKVAPEFVKETPEGIKMVDTYGLLGMTMKAVQDLAKKVEEKN